MQTAKRRRTTWAIGASALAHVAVLILALLQRPTLPLPADEEAGPPEAIIPILIMPRTPPLAAAGAPQPSAVRLHRRPQLPDDNPPPAALLPAPAPARAAPVRSPEPHPDETGGALSAPSAAASPPAPDLRLALRHGVAGCANGGAAGMTREERERCDDQLAVGVALAPVLNVPLEPRIRRYYDAVALAKTRDPPTVPPNNSRTPIPGDAPPHRPGADHIPLLGCALPFGAGEKHKLPVHWLKLGPCFIAPPKGPFTQEADITPP